MQHPGPEKNRDEQTKTKIMKNTVHFVIEIDEAKI
jgi:hypothetical protein